MIHINNNVRTGINNYVGYLIRSKENSQRRAIQKRNLMTQSLLTNLQYVINGNTIGEPTKYKGLGSDEGCLLFVYEDKRAGSRWGFGYKVYKTRKGIKIIVKYMQNMQLAANSYNPNQQNNNANPQQNNQQNTQKPIQYQPVSKECFGQTMVKSSNGLFNFINQNKEFFCKKWYKNATNFEKYPNGRIAAKIFDGSQWHWLYSEGYTEVVKKGSYMPESYKNPTNDVLFERDRLRILDVMKKVCKY